MKKEKFYVDLCQVNKAKKFVNRKIEQNENKMCIARSFLSEKYITNPKYYRNQIGECINENEALNYILYLINFIEYVCNEIAEDEKKNEFEQQQIS